MSGAESVVAVESLNLRLGRFALSDVDLAIRRGETMVLLGPTGGGKTVLLETIIGIHRPASGRIRVNGVVVNDWPPEDRRIGYVPQDYSLFPNLTVSENVAFGPRVHGWPREKAAARVRDLLAMLGIAHLADRHPVHLSGGEKQRVAMGRALAVQPEVLILDEPLSALDENRRSELAAGLRQIQRRVEGTFLHVCHNLDEAAEVADRVAILHEGRIVQTGSISDVLYRPATAFVARFTGARNVFACRSEGEDRLVLEDGSVLQTARRVERAAAVAIRPEAIRLLEGGGALPEGNVFDAEVAAVTSRALTHELSLRLDGKAKAWRLVVPRSQGSDAPGVGARVRVHVPPDAVWPMER